MSPPASGAARGGLLRNPYLWATVASLIVIPAMRPLLRFEPSPPPLFAQLPELRLVDQEGNPFTRAALAPGVTVAGLFSTRCRSQCPRLMAALGALESRYREAAIDRVRLLAITVEPEHDSPAVLRAYAAEHGLDASRWTLLTGSEAEVRRVISALRTGDPLVRAQWPDGSPPPWAAVPSPVEVAHQGRVVLLDSAGGVRGFYGTDEAGLDEVFHRSRHVLDERRPPRPVRWPHAGGV